MLKEAGPTYPWVGVWDSWCLHSGSNCTFWEVTPISPHSAPLARARGHVGHHPRVTSLAAPDQEPALLIRSILPLSYKLALRVQSAGEVPFAAYRALRRPFKCTYGGYSHQSTAFTALTEKFCTFARWNANAACMCSAPQQRRVHVKIDSVPLCTRG